MLPLHHDPVMGVVSVSVARELAWCGLLSVAREGVEPSFPPYQSGVLNRWTTGLVVESGWPDSNRRFRAPKARGVPLPYIPSCVSDPCGIRTQPLRLERPATSPEVKRAVSCAHRMRKVGREAPASPYRPRPSSSLIARRPRLLLLVFSQALEPSQLPTRDRGRTSQPTKKARCRGDTGLGRRSPSRPSVICADSGRGTNRSTDPDGPIVRDRTLNPDVRV